MAVTTGGRWTDDGGIASGRFTSFLGGSGGVVAWSIAGAGLANQLNSSSLPNFTTTEDLGTFLPPGYEQILREAFDLWAAVADIEFIQVADSGYAFGSVSYPTIRIGGGYIDGGAYGSTWGYAFYPSSWGPGGDIVFDSSNTALSETDFRWLALHEIGHAIGLDHTTIQPAVMYRFFEGVTALQPDDISGITAVYGAQDFGPNNYYLPLGQLNVGLIDGAPQLSVYGNFENNVIDGTAGTERIFGREGDDTLISRFGQDLLDGGTGNDTVDYGFADTDLTIDFFARTVTNIPTGETDTLVDIENVTAGSGNDAIWIASVLGDNRIDGGPGHDVVNIGYYFNAGYLISGTATELVLSGVDGSDTFIRVEDIAFVDGTVLSPEELLAGTLLPGVISVSDVSIAEGNGGTRVATFVVSRTGGHADVGVDIATADGSATSAGADYVPLSRTLAFTENVHSHQVAVTINGDFAFEADETFFLVLSGATNGAVTGDPGIATIENDDVSGPEVSVLGNGVSIADGDLTPDLADHTGFGTVGVGSVVTRTFTVANDGSQTLTIAKLKMPKGFALTEGLSASLAPGVTDTFTVGIDTKKAGARAGEVTFTTNDPDEAAFNFALAGNVVLLPPEIEVRGNGNVISDGDLTPGTTDGTDFGNATIGSVVIQTFTVNNSGPGTLSISKLKAPKGFKVVEKLDASIAPGGSDSFQLQLDTKKVGLKSGQLTFTTNDPDETPFNFALSANVTATPASLPALLDNGPGGEAAAFVFAQTGDEFQVGLDDLGHHLGQRILHHFDLV